MSLKITQFEAENVKRIKALTLTPDANGLTIIGGRNGQGKTSTLDAITWALGGERYRPTQAWRDGSVLPPRLKVTLSDGTVVERKGKNSALTVTDPAGRKSGQQLLNSLIEDLALNMPKFMAASSKEKAVTLLRIIGLEEQVATLERREKELYSQRQATGQIATQKADYAKELPLWPDAPAEPLSAFELIQQQQEILARNGENQRKRERAAQLEQEKQELRRQLDDIQARYETVCRDCDVARKSALDLLDESTDALEASIRNVDAINIKVRDNQKKQDATKEAQKYAKQYEELTGEIEEVRRQKQVLLEGAKLPLPELSVEDGELTYRGQRWDCISGSDQLKVSAAIVRAVKPQCGFVLMDKLEQMDADTLREFGEWAESEGLQIISTRVSTGDECSIIIEDGYAVDVPRTASVSPAPQKPWKEGVF